MVIIFILIILLVVSIEAEDKHLESCDELGVKCEEGFTKNLLKRAKNEIALKYNEFKKYID